MILKSIDLSGVSLTDQYLKTEEENREFIEAAEQYSENMTEENKQHWIEEFWDRFQSAKGLMEKYCITNDDLRLGYLRHLNKLNSRPRKDK